jgi:hypothetical protein
MKPRTIFSAGGVAVAAVLMFAIVGSALAQAQPGLGPGGMMGGRGSVGQGYGPGMMGGGGMMGGPGMMGGWSTTSAQAQPINSLDDARLAFQRQIDATGNKNLVLDDVMQFQWNYYAIVKDTSTGQGAFELLANPQTGAVFPEMGPNMMWNTQYGHMAGVGMMGGYSARQGVEPTVSADKAQQIAQEWLDRNQPGSSTEAPDAFPGYYTLHITRDGAVAGMLSVNAYTGQVWYHTWHGAFVAAA